MMKLKTAISLAAVVSVPLAAGAQKAKPARVSPPTAQAQGLKHKAGVAPGKRAKGAPAAVKPGGRVSIEHKANVARGAGAKRPTRALIGEDGKRAIEAKANVQRGKDAKRPPATIKSPR